MQVSYTVHSANECPVQLVVDINGVPTQVSAPGLSVELVNDRNGHTFSFLPEDMDAALELFAPGASVNVTFSAAE